MRSLRKSNRNALPLSQRRRPRPSRIKIPSALPKSPAARLQLALELSDFCLALRDAARRKR
jgi:hypothetical protein